MLSAHPICPCGAPAMVADHIVPLAQGGDWSLENGQGLCASCHGRKTAAERPGGWNQ